MKNEARPILFRLQTSQDAGTRLDAGLALLVALDHVTENDKLLQVAEKAMAAAAEARQLDARTYLLSQMAELLSVKLSTIAYRQRNLNLAAGVFKWIEFSLEEDK